MSFSRLLISVVLTSWLASPLALLAGDDKRERLTKEQQLARDLEKQDRRLQAVREYTSRSSTTLQGSRTIAGGCCQVAAAGAERVWLQRKPTLLNA